MASVHGSSGTRQRRGPVEDDLQHHHYMEEPDLDVSSLVTEFVPLEDPFVPYFDAPHEEMESLLGGHLESSFASSIGEEGIYARFRPRPAGFPQNTSTPRFAEDRVEVPRARGSGTSPQWSDDVMAEMMDGMDGHVHHGGSASRSPLLTEQSPTARLYNEPPPAPSMADQFLHAISRLVTDTSFARTTNCFRSKIPNEVSEEALISFVTYCVRFPMRRPVNTLLQARSSPLLLEQILKTAMDGQVEAYDSTMTRDSYFRITLRNTVQSLAHLHQIVRATSLEQRGFVDVTYSPVRGRVAFIGYNGNLPIRMSQPIAPFIECEQEARLQLNALFSAEITLARCGDDAREVYITYFDNIETNTRTGQQARVTEVNVYHIIHPSPSPLPSSASPPPTRHGRVSFNPATPKHHEVLVEKRMVSLSVATEPTYTMADCMQLSRAYPQHKW